MASLGGAIIDEMHLHLQAPSLWFCLARCFDVIEGKEGRFHETMLGKRVDYSGRLVNMTKIGQFDNAYTNWSHAQVHNPAG
ncbi:DNA-directed RNA polymerase subunit beta' [Linum perenne]